MLQLIIHEKNIETVEREEYVRGTVGAKCKITFDSFWQDYEKTVVFKRCDFSTPPIRVFVNEMEVTPEIPPEVLAQIGNFMVGAYGVTENEKLPTLYSEEFDVVYGTDTECVDPSKYTPSELEQLRLQKQDKLIAGENITIDKNNVISAKGGGGTTDYADLDNKPKINGVELVGDMTTDDLFLVDKEKFDNTIGHIESLLGGI